MRGVAMPGCSRLSIDLLLETAKQCRDEGVCGVALFPCVPDHLKTKDARERYRISSHQLASTRIENRWLTLGDHGRAV